MVARAIIEEHYRTKLQVNEYPWTTQCLSKGGKSVTISPVVKPAGTVRVVDMNNHSKTRAVRTAVRRAIRIAAY